MLFIWCVVTIPESYKMLCSEIWAVQTGFCYHQTWSRCGLDPWNRQKYFALFFDMTFIFIVSKSATFLTRFTVTITENHNTSITWNRITNWHLKTLSDWWTDKSIWLVYSNIKLEFKSHLRKSLANQLNQKILEVSFFCDTNELFAVFCYKLGIIKVTFNNW